MSRGGIYRSVEGAQEVMSLYAQTLAKWPVPFATREVATRHGGTFVIECGRAQAPALVLVHGACSNALSWMGDVAAYAPHFRVLAVDVPGEPGRSAPLRPDHQGPAFAEWMEDVLDGVGVASTSLLGISKGGEVVLKFATTHPARVDKLVLLAPGGIAPVRTSFLLRAVALSLCGEWGRARINGISFSGDQVDPAAVEFMDIIMRNFHPEVSRPYLFSDEELRRLTMPTLMVVGENDALMDSPRILARTREIMPRAERLPLAGRGHVLMGLADTIAPFLLGPAGT